jgi:hypothetical protein
MRRSARSGNSGSLVARAKSPDEDEEEEDEDEGEEAKAAASLGRRRSQSAKCPMTGFVPLPVPVRWPLHGSEPTMRSIVQKPSTRLCKEVTDDERSTDNDAGGTDDADDPDDEEDDEDADEAALAPALFRAATMAAMSFGCQLRSAAARALTAASIGGHSIGTRRIARRSAPALTDCSVNQPSMEADGNDDDADDADDEDADARDDDNEVDDDAEEEEADEEEEEAGKKLAGSCVRSNSSCPSRRSEKLDESSTKTDRICEASTGAADDDAADTERTADDDDADAEAARSDPTRVGRLLPLSANATPLVAASADACG